MQLALPVVMLCWSTCFRHLNRGTDAMFQIVMLMHFGNLILQNCSTPISYSAPEAPVKSVEVSRSSPAKSVKPVEGSSLSSADIIPRKDLSRTFSFSLPQSVIESSEVLAVTEAQKSYSFSAPSPVRAGEDCPTSSHSNIRLVAVSPPWDINAGHFSGAVPCFNFKPSPSSLSSANTDIRNNLETNFLANKSMPDITNNTLRKVSSTNKLKGNFLLLDCISVTTVRLQDQILIQASPMWLLVQGLVDFCQQKSLKLGPSWIFSVNRNHSLSSLSLL